MSSGVFSKYEGVENRITAAFTATLRTLSIQSFDFVLQRLSSETAGDTFLAIYDQRSRGGDGVPDADISASFSVIVETKLTTDAFRSKQLQNHARRLVGTEPVGMYKHRMLLTISPDPEESRELSNLRDEYDDTGIVFSHMPFARLRSVFEELLEERRGFMTEIESFVISEFMEQLSVQGLVGFAKKERLGRTMVVAGGHAWPYYKQISADIHIGGYVCQPNRSYTGAGYLAFYYDKRIISYVPSICAVFPEVEVSLVEPRNDSALQDVLSAQIVLGPAYSESDSQSLIKQAIDVLEYDVRHGHSGPDDVRMVFVLSTPHDSGTIVLPNEVMNNEKDKNGDLSPYTMGVWRNVATDTLKIAKVTSDLRNQ